MFIEQRGKIVEWTIFNSRPIFGDVQTASDTQKKIKLRIPPRGRGQTKHRLQPLEPAIDLAARSSKVLDEEWQSFVNGLELGNRGQFVVSAHDFSQIAVNVNAREGCQETQMTAEMVARWVVVVEMTKYIQWTLDSYTEEPEFGDLTKTLTYKSLAHPGITELPGFHPFLKCPALDLAFLSHQFSDLKNQMAHMARYSRLHDAFGLWFLNGNIRKLKANGVDVSWYATPTTQAALGHHHSEYEPTARKWVANVLRRRGAF
ncbi:hypothetical protein T439DRAFT_381634 [Meredithblackwellia eburnea MCA 4105]